MEAKIRVVERMSKMELSREHLFGLIGRLLRLPESERLLSEGLDEIERGRTPSRLQSTTGHDDVEAE
jgi:hypothetical protein